MRTLKDLDAKEDYEVFRSELEKYGLKHLLYHVLDENWMQLDHAVQKTKERTLTIQACPKCELGGEFTISLEEVLEAEGYIECDYCATPLYPLERKVKK